jgi:hypothetical protein
MARLSPASGAAQRLTSLYGWPSTNLAVHDRTCMLLAHKSLNGKFWPALAALAALLSAAGPDWRQPAGGGAEEAMAWTQFGSGSGTRRSRRRVSGLPVRATGGCRWQGR